MIDARRLRLALAAALLAGAVTPADAQALNAGGPKPPAASAAKDDDAADAPPPAIPGAASSPDLVAPPSKVAAEMMPNEALFDGINRGDLAAARDALNRGADLNARNVLGQTPLDSSIDLNRNDITFLLLSMRPSSNTPGGSASGEAAAAAAPGSTAASRTSASRMAASRTAAGKPARAVRAKLARAPAAAPLARQFAGDGGAPNPAVGFVGFDQGR